MEAKVEVKMTPKIMYDFMMYHTYRSFSGIFGIILGICDVWHDAGQNRSVLQHRILSVRCVVYRLSSGQPLYKIKKAGRKKRSI